VCGAIQNHTNNYSMNQIESLLIDTYYGFDVLFPEYNPSQFVDLFSFNKTVWESVRNSSVWNEPTPYISSRNRFYIFIPKQFPESIIQKKVNMLQSEINQTYNISISNWSQNRELLCHNNPSIPIKTSRNFIGGIIDIRQFCVPYEDKIIKYALSMSKIQYYNLNYDICDLTFSSNERYEQFTFIGDDNRIHCGMMDFEGGVLLIDRILVYNVHEVM
jgi:hypothetical protein